MRALLQRLSRRLPTEHGMSLIEVVVAMMIFTVVSLSVLGALVQTLAVTRDNRSRAAAANLAAQEIDRARDVEDIFQILDKTTTVDLDGDVFTVKRTTAWVANTDTGIACGTGGGNLRYKRINISVSWPNMRTGAEPARADTVIDPRSRIVDPAFGTIIIAVTGGAGTGVAGVKVTGTPDPSGANGAVAFEQPALTDAQGCTYVRKVVPGNYVLKDEKTDNVSTTHLAATQQQISVSAGATASKAFILDKKARYAVQLAAGAPSDVLFAPSTPVRFVNTKGTHAPTGSGRNRNYDLFPWADGYSVLAGAYSPKPSDGSAYCASPDASQWKASEVGGVQYADGANAFGVAEAGGSVVVPVRMGVVTVNATAALSGQITATPVSPAAETADPGCTTPATTTAQLVFPAPSGSLVDAKTRSIALPWGTWRISANGLPLSALTVQAPAPSVVNGQTVTVDPRLPAATP